LAHNQGGAGETVPPQWNGCHLEFTGARGIPRGGPAEPVLARCMEKPLISEDAGVAKSVDAGDLKSPGLRPLRVQLPPPALSPARRAGPLQQLPSASLPFATFSQRTCQRVPVQIAHGCVPERSRRGLSRGRWALVRPLPDTLAITVVVIVSEVQERVPGGRGRKARERPYQTTLAITVVVIVSEVQERVPGGRGRKARERPYQTLWL
jgi:hypothetical protein